MRANWIAPLYLSVSWILTVTYQLFTETAVNTLASLVSITWPAAGVWLINNVAILTFIYAFTWIFVLSSVIPSLILGKQRSILVQYVVVLALSLIAFFMADILQITVGITLNDLYNASSWLTNPAIAVIYLAIPYLFMIALDLISRKKNKKLADLLTPTQPATDVDGKGVTPEN